MTLLTTAMMPTRPEDDREQIPPRGRAAGPRPGVPPYVPPDVLRDVTGLSRPGAPGANPYVLAPPPGPPDPARGGGTATDRLMAGLAHAGILFGFLGIGFLVALGISLTIWIAGRRSPYIAYHARQAGCYQGFVLLANGGLLLLVLVCWGFAALYPQWAFVGNFGAVLFVLGAAWFVGSILYGVVGAVLVLLGHPFAYPVFGRRR